MFVLVVDPHDRGKVYKTTHSTFFHAHRYRLYHIFLEDVAGQGFDEVNFDSESASLAKTMTVAG